MMPWKVLNQKYINSKIKLVKESPLFKVAKIRLEVNQKKKDL